MRFSLEARPTSAPRCRTRPTRQGPWWPRAERPAVWTFRKSSLDRVRSADLRIRRALHAPPNRYYTDWGLYPNQPYIIGPPWSAIVAYDLNTGTIKWRVPLGEDARAAEEGAKNAGVFMAERHGIIVTSTGLLFVATTDGKVRAHDEETGKVLWTGDAAGGLRRRARDVRSERAAVSRRAGLVENQHRRRSPAPGRARLASPVTGTPGYVAFALPRK